MANLPLTHLILNDTWPGVPNVQKGIPTDGWDNTFDNFNTADDTAKAFVPPQPIGEKRMVYTDNTNAPGYYTMMYLAYHDPSSVDISADFSDSAFWCAHTDTTHASPLGADLSTPPYYIVSRCYTAAFWDGTKGSPIAVPCSTSIEADSSVDFGTGDPASNGFGHGWGWFWVGGVCPVKDATLLDDGSGNFKGADVTTDTLMRKGTVILEVTVATGHLMTADASNAGDVTTQGEGPDSAALIIGWVDSSAE